MDKVDLNPRYLENANMSAWQNEVDNFFKNVLFNLDIPKGFIVEFGTFRCVSFNKLIKHFGQDRCFGFDIVNYENHPNVVECDVRTDLKFNLISNMAFAWNDISEWHGSPESKLAILNYTNKKLVPGGYYMDDALHRIPNNNRPNYELVYSMGNITLWKN